MSSHKSKSGPVRVVGTVPKITLTPEQQRALDMHRSAIRAAKQAEKEAYERNLKLKGAGRL